MGRNRGLRIMDGVVGLTGVKTEFGLGRHPDILCLPSFEKTVECPRPTCGGYPVPRRTGPSGHPKNIAAPLLDQGLLPWQSSSSSSPPPEYRTVRAFESISQHRSLWLFMDFYREHREQDQCSATNPTPYAADLSRPKKSFFGIPKEATPTNQLQANQYL